MERGIDPHVKKYFRKIVYSFTWGWLWLASNAIAGIYFGLAYRTDLPLVWIIVFYLFLILSLSLLLHFYYRTWKK
jgi:hypothetical protein